MFRKFLGLTQDEWLLAILSGFAQITTVKYSTEGLEMKTGKQELIVDLRGYEARIVDIIGKLPDSVDEPKIRVRLEFTKPIGSMSVTSILLPIKQYTRDELIKAVCDEGTKSVDSQLKAIEFNRRLQAERDSRRRALDADVNNYKSLLGLK